MFLTCVAIIDENSKKALLFFCFPQVVVGYLLGFKKPKLPFEKRCFISIFEAIIQSVCFHLKFGRFLLLHY